MVRWGDTKFKHGVGSTTICLARDGGLTPNKECSNKFCLKEMFQLICKNGELVWS